MLQIAAIADIHGNCWALDAVLVDIKRRKIETIVNLGDSLYGPLDPVVTAEKLLNERMIHIRGNQDRVIIDPPEVISPTLAFVRESLRKEHFSWLQSLPETKLFLDELFLCHGSPTSDTEYLLENPSELGSYLKTSEEIMKSLQNLEQRIILCAHSHISRTITLPDGKIVINPGSVGLPAFFDELPMPHKMEVGSPHARYAILSKYDDDWHIDHVLLPYDWQKAAASAREKSQEEWAQRLASGRA